MDHGFAVAAYAVSERVGVATKANLVFVRGATDVDFFDFERYVEATMLIADDTRVGIDEGVVNLSFGVSMHFASDVFIAWIWCKLLSPSDDNETNE